MADLEPAGGRGLQDLRSFMQYIVRLRGVAPLVLLYRRGGAILRRRRSALPKQSRRKGPEHAGLFDGTGKLQRPFTSCLKRISSVKASVDNSKSVYEFRRGA